MNVSALVVFLLKVFGMESYLNSPVLFIAFIICVGVFNFVYFVRGGKYMKVIASIDGHNSTKHDRVWLAITGAYVFLSFVVMLVVFAS